jgi:phosphoribosylformimino-5-aminoimidazole carboxamide ribotide isomerase
MKIIPAIDIIDGKCVRLSKGDYSTQKTYNENPLEVAKQFEANGIEYLHLVDLDGARSNKIINHKVLEKIANNTQLKIDFGGGLKSNEDIEIAFNSGAHQITGGSIAVKNPEVFKNWIIKYGADKIILGADVNVRNIAVSGWLEDSGLDIVAFIKNHIRLGLHTVICTDIAKDGMLQGASIDLYKELQQEIPNLNLIASGGVASMNDLEQLLEMKMHGAIIGKAIYEGNISLKELEAFILKDN